MMKKLIGAALALYLCVASIQAQDYLKNCRAVPPAELVGANIDGLLEGSTTLKSGRVLKWFLMYDKKQNKPMVMSFTCPDDVDKAVFDATIQAMTAPEYWTGISNCISTYPDPNQSINCIIEIQRRSLSDCFTTLSDAHCWMLNK